MEYQIYSFGNGEVLKGVFNAVALCLNSSSGSLYTPLIRLGLLIGAAFAIIYALYGNAVRVFIGWIIPVTAIMQLLFVPQVTVWIIDPVSRYHQKVDHVPYGLGILASYISQIGHGITEQIEKVFVLPDDLKYQKTGMLFGSYLMQQAKTFHITNEDLAKNMRQFVGQCVAYDALLGRKYTIEELRHSADIWGLVSKEASPARSFLWREPLKEGRSKRPEIITCRQGVTLFNKQWGEALNQAASLFGTQIFGDILNPRAELLKHLPLSYGYLTEMSQSAADILKQHLMIYAVVDGLEQKSVALGNAPNFAVRRAYLQQKATYETLGAMAAEMLPTMKSVLEAVAYASFLFVIPLSLLPAGWRFVSSWVQVLLWLQMWAPLYAVLNYIMTLSARSQSIAALSLSNKEGVSIANSVGLANANADISAMAGYLSMSIPFLCIALVRGVGSFVHLASYLSNVTQGAASGSASDAVSGNYGLGNISEGNRQISNTSMLNQGYAASYRSGSFHQSDGRSDLLTAADGQQILNVASSNIPISINVAETKAAQLSELASKGYQKASSQAETSAESFGDAYRQLVNLDKQLSSGQQFSDQVSQGKTVEQAQAIQKGSQMLKKFAKDNELDFQAAMELLGEAGIGINLGISGSLPLRQRSSGQGSPGKTVGKNKAIQSKDSQNLLEAPRNLEVEPTKAIQKGSRDLLEAPQMLEKFSKDNAFGSFGSPFDSQGLEGIALNVLGLGKIGVSLRVSRSQMDRDIYNEAESLAKSKEFQDTMKAASQASNALSHTTNDEEIRRSAENFAGSYEKAHHFRTEATKSFRAAEDYQRQATHTQTFASSINANYTQEFVDWLAGQQADNTGGTLGKQGAGHIIANQPQLGMLYAQRFLQEKGLAVAAPVEVAKHGGNGDRLKAAYDNDTTTAVNQVTAGAINQVREQIKEEKLDWDNEAAQALRQNVKSAQTKGDQAIEQAGSSLDNTYQHANKVFEKQKGKMIVQGNLMEHPSLIPPSKE